MKLSRRSFASIAMASAAAPSLNAARAQSKTRISFFYPVQVGGPLTQVIDGYVARFMAANPDVEVESVYSGNYIDTTTKALTAAKAGAPPTTAVLLATDIYTFLDEDVIVPIDGLVKTDADRAWLGGFMPAFLKSAQVGGKLWSIPFQRSTAVLYWNKKAFAESGHRHDQPTFRELVWNSDIRSIALPPEYNVRYIKYKYIWSLAEAVPMIYHMKHYHRGWQRAWLVGPINLVLKVFGIRWATLAKKFNLPKW